MPWRTLICINGVPWIDHHVISTWQRSYRVKFIFTVSVQGFCELRRMNTWPSWPLQPKNILLSQQAHGVETTLINASLLLICRRGSKLFSSLAGRDFSGRSVWSGLLKFQTFETNLPCTKLRWIRTDLAKSFTFTSSETFKNCEEAEIFIDECRIGPYSRRTKSCLLWEIDSVGLRLSACHGSWIKSFYNNNKPCSNIRSKRPVGFETNCRVYISKLIYTWYQTRYASPRRFFQRLPIPAGKWHTNDVVLTSSDVITSHHRRYDVILAPNVHWDICVFHQGRCNKSWLRDFDEAVLIRTDCEDVFVEEVLIRIANFIETSLIKSD